MTSGLELIMPVLAIETLSLSLLAWVKREKQTRNLGFSAWFLGS